MNNAASSFCLILHLLSNLLLDLLKALSSLFRERFVEDELDHRSIQFRAIPHPPLEHFLVYLGLGFYVFVAQIYTCERRPLFYLAVYQSELLFFPAPR